MSAGPAPMPGPPDHPGGPDLALRVARVDRGAVHVLDGDGHDLRVALDRDGLVPDADGVRWAPTVGDLVRLGTRADGEPHVRELLPRRSAVVRDAADRSARTQALAANVDVVLIAEHLDPDPALGRVERLLALAWRSGARPVVVLTKADLVPDPSGMAAEVAAVAPGADVHVVAAARDEGLDPIRALLTEGTTLVVLGPSGAGKSTLVNALAGADLMATGGRRSDGRGRHTTTHRELVPLPGGALLIDTPGLRGIGLVADEESIGATFPEVEELAASCRFRDCSHRTEPGCAVRAALDTGALSERRFDSYRRLAREAAFQARRADARLAAQEHARWKKVTVDMRRRAARP